MDLKKAEKSFRNSSQPPGRDHQVKTTTGPLRWATQTLGIGDAAPIVAPVVEQVVVREIIDGLQLGPRLQSEHRPVADGSHVPSVQFSAVQPPNSGAANDSP
jgi:hypothetical protein